MDDIEKRSPSLEQFEKDHNDEESRGEAIGVEIVGVNASGHADQLDRQYGLLSICATALTIGQFTLIIDYL